jgi:uncharacterized protein YdeI (YjbR/CyaY-like superfamily)
MNPKVDAFIQKAKKWQDELTELRKIALSCDLSEEYKWGVPCFTFQKSNLLLISGFKEYCVLSFVKGALLKDSNGILIQQTENSQSVRILRFTNVEEIREKQAILKSYIFEAIEAEKAGLKVILKGNSELVFPEELLAKFTGDEQFKNAFKALTPGRQRAYNLFFSAPKQTSTRETRIEKYHQQILNGKGITDCTCGLSKKPPNCDGSHKFFRID